jgi:hypothetical protein
MKQRHKYHSRGEAYSDERGSALQALRRYTHPQ